MDTEKELVVDGATAGKSITTATEEPNHGVANFRIGGMTCGACVEVRLIVG